MEIEIAILNVPKCRKKQLKSKSAASTTGLYLRFEVFKPDLVVIKHVIQHSTTNLASILTVNMAATILNLISHIPGTV